MNFYNPMQSLMQMRKSSQKPFLNIQNPASNQNINIQQLKQITPQLSKEDYAQLVSQARAQGISEKDIEDGLNFLLSLN